MSQEMRERILLVVGAILLLAVVLPLLNHFYGSPMFSLRSEIARRTEELTKLQREEELGKNAARELQSLIARSLAAQDASRYSNWLYKLAEASQIKNSTLSPPTTRKNAVKESYTVFTFTLRGRGSLKAVSQFLQEFRRVDLLHSISSVSLNPVRGSDEITISMTIEAISFPQKKSTGTLAMNDRASSISPERIKAMMQTITSRAMFSEFRERATAPPTTPTTVEVPRVPDFDHSPHIILTGTTEANGIFMAWIDYRSRGEKKQVLQGETFLIEGTSCILREVGFDRIIVEALGTRYVIRVGKSFADFEEETQE